jgi:HEAT repeat protein
MMDHNQLKSHGVRYARSLLMLIKMVGMFSADHSTAAAPFQNSFNLLNGILKQTGQFTIGFVDNRLMLNNVLTSERSLESLENEFLKRGMAAITFPPGLTLSSYKRAIGILAAAPKTIEEHGGLRAYLEQYPLEMVRVFPAGKNQIRTETGDTILEQDSEAFLMSKAMGESRSSNPLESFERILQSAAASAGADAGGGGAATGTAPEQAGVGAGSDDGGAGFSTPNPGGGTGGLVEIGGAGGNPREIMGLVDNFLEASFLSGKDLPGGAYSELAKAIQDMRPDLVLAQFSPEKREQLRQLPPDQMATEILEEQTVQWAAQRLSKVSNESDSEAAEQEVMRVLIRSLEATSMAERLASKLAEHLVDVSLPQSVKDRIQDDLKWVGLSPNKKTEFFLGLRKIDGKDFRRMLEHVQDRIKHGSAESANQVAKHYLTAFKDSHEIAPEDFSRLQEVMRLMAPARTSFWPEAAELFGRLLSDPALSQFAHTQVLNVLVTLARSVALYEEFELISTVGNSIQACFSANTAGHQDCCGNALASLMNTNAVERSLELFLQRKDDVAFARVIATLMRWTGPAAVEKVFEALEKEQVTANRLALIRLIGRVGPVALEVARQQLKSETWYVVRNACKLLAELKDPELLQQIAPALAHTEPRVQKAAVTAVLESRKPDRGVPLAEALTFLHSQLLEQAMTELLFLKDPKTVPGLQRFIVQPDHSDTKSLRMAVQTLAAIPGKQAEQVLLQVLLDTNIDTEARRTALVGVSKRPEATPTHRQFAERTADVIAEECKKMLAEYWV